MTNDLATQQAQKFITFYTRVKGNIFAKWEFWCLNKNFNSIELAMIYQEVIKTLKFPIDKKQLASGDK